MTAAFYLPCRAVPSIRARFGIDGFRSPPRRRRNIEYPFSNSLRPHSALSLSPFSGRIPRRVGRWRLSDRECVCRNQFVRFLHFRKFVGFAEANANERDKDNRMPASANKTAAVFASLINPLKFKEAQKRESLTFSLRPFLNGVPEGGRILSRVMPLRRRGPHPGTDILTIGSVSEGRFKTFPNGWENPSSPKPAISESENRISRNLTKTQVLLNDA